MHSNIGYICTLALNLSLLLPLADNPKVDNYVIVLCVIYFLEGLPISRTEQCLSLWQNEHILGHSWYLVV